MKQEEKDLLLADLCGRLPYGVKLETLEGPQKLDLRWLSINMCNIANPYLPYLFPISSMTEEQLKLFDGTFLPNGHVVTSDLGLDYLNSIHVDYRGLIPMGLAIDATNLNIY